MQCRPTSDPHRKVERRRKRPGRGVRGWRLSPSKMKHLRLIWSPSAFAASSRRRPAVRILQLGDSHTAADFFSGELRQRLQARFGVGGPGYLAAGTPRFGVRTGLFKVTASSGWTYQTLQKSDNASQFWLSGFNAVSAATGNSITYKSDKLVTFDSIEFDGIRQPQGGSVEVRLDGVLAS